MSSQAGKVAVVTGAGRGIGKAISLRLARSGCRVILAARSADELETVREEIRSAGGEGLTIPTDLTKDNEVSRLLEQSRKTWGDIDILINNAGWGRKAPVVRARLDDWDYTFRLNLRAPMMLAQMVLPAMIARGSGAIINIGSISGKSGEANSSAYAVSKFGLIGFTQSLYEEVREFGIKVAIILPGFVDTGLIPPNRHIQRAKMIRPEDVADSVMFVLSSSATCCPVEITIRPQRTPYK